MPLEPGYYELFSGDFNASHPLRALVAGRELEDPHDLPNREVVARLLPPGDEISRWRVDKIGPELFTLTLNSDNAKILNGSLRLSRAPLPPFVWKIVPQNSAPHRPDVYSISVPERPDENWFVRGDLPVVELPVVIFDTRTPILFHRVHE